MPIHELAALGAATCWALTGLISAGPAGHLGAIAFNRTRQVFVTGLLAVYVLGTGTWRDLDAGAVGPLLLSGLVGIFLGDTLLFATLNRLGPRRSGIIFALNAPIAAVLGWLALGEALAPPAVAGVALTLAGVLLAILFGKPSGRVHQWEEVRGPLWAGVAIGLGAATGQALGSIIARPVMAAGLDPFAASMLRVGIAALCLTVLIQMPIPAVKPRAPLTWRVAALTALTGDHRTGDRYDAAAIRARGRQGRDRLDAVGHLAGHHPADALGQHRPATGRRRLGRRGAGRGRHGADLPQVARLPRPHRSPCGSRRRPGRRSNSPPTPNRLCAGDSVQLLRFARETAAPTPMTSSKEPVLAAIDASTARGDTALYDALFQSIDLLAERRGRKAVVVLSDGVDDDGTGRPRSTHTIAELLDRAAEVNVPIFVIGLGTETDEAVLSDIAATTGAQYLNAPDTDELGAVYGQISDQLSGQYAIRYTSSLPADGTERRVDLNALDAQDSKLYTPPGEVAAAPQAASAAQGCGPSDAFAAERTGLEKAQDRYENSLITVTDRDTIRREAVDRIAAAIAAAAPGFACLNAALGEAAAFYDNELIAVTARDDLREALVEPMPWPSWGALRRRTDRVDRPRRRARKAARGRAGPERFPIGQDHGPDRERGGAHEQAKNFHYLYQ